MGVEDGHVGRAVEGRRPDETLVEDARERVLIRASIDVAPLDLLRRAVGDRADEAARAGRPGRGELLHDAEVREERAVAGADEDVARLHVAVDHARAVREAEGPGDRVGDLRGTPRRDGSLFQDVRQRATVHVPLAGAGLQIHSAHRLFAAADRMYVLRIRHGYFSSLAKVSGVGCCAACGCSAVGYTRSLRRRT